MNRQKGLSPILLVVLIALGIIGYLIYQGQITFSSPQQTTQSLSDVTKEANLAPSNLKIYTNDFYHIKLSIPSDWKTAESVRQDGLPTFKLSSPNNEIIIESPLPDQNNHIKTDLGNLEVSLGQYKINRSRYINDDNKTVDYVSLYNIKRQKLINLQFTINRDYESNNNILLDILKTFAFTKEEPILDEFLTYIIPNDWKKDSYDPSQDLSLHSPDYTVSQGAGYIASGASIYVSRFLRNPSRNLKDEVVNLLPTPLREKTDGITQITIGGLEGLHNFSCWEGCFDSYYVIKDNYFWIFNFQCAPDCDTKAKVDANKYAKDRDAFINSVMFKKR